MSRGSRKTRKAKKAHARRAKRQALAVVAELDPLGRATPERIAHAGDQGTETAPNGRQRIIAAPLDRLLAAGFIALREFDAGDRLRADAYMAAIDPGALTVDWNRTNGGFSARVPSVFSTQQVADARLRYRRLRRLIGGAVWETLHLAIIREADLPQIGGELFGIRDRREAIVAARVGIRVALAALADCYEHRALVRVA